MKGRISSTLWWVFGINAAVLAAVLGLSYAAGARSGGLGLRDFSILPPLAGFELLGAVFLVVVGSGALFIYLDTKIRKPVADLVDFSEKLTAGDHEIRADVRPDDFGVMAENFNRAAETLAQSAELQAAKEKLTGELTELEKTIAQLGRGELNARARTGSDLLASVAQGFNTSVDVLARRIERVRAAAGEVAVGAAQTLATTSEAADSIASTEQDSLAALPLVEELAAGGRQVNADSTAAAEASRRALNYADQGNRAVRDASDGMQRIRSSMQATAAKIKALGDRSLEIYEIINIVHETNLLALNAVLEASRGGGAQPLDILASEMRKLADYSRGATRDIVTLLKSIQAESNEAVMAMEQANRVAETGSRLTEQASKAFAGIANLLQQTADLAQAISASSAKQVQGTDTVRGSVQTLAEHARQNAGRGHEAARHAEQVTRLAAQLNEIMAQFRTGPAVVKPEVKFEVKAEIQPETAEAAAASGRA